MKRFRVAGPNWTGLPVGYVVKVDANALNERDRDRHAADLRNDRLVWLRDTAGPDEPTAGNMTPPKPPRWS